MSFKQIITKKNMNIKQIIRKGYLLNIITVKIITRLAAINASTFSIDTIFTELEPACGS
ncbi:hypothetical protein HanRHA438_Chr05g0242651 [Helianthus annuus]|nr:hypothetical protein HanRHA438_Chr05g0242651 [Helianthus annuus]